MGRFDALFDQPGPGRKAQPITKEVICHYVYAVLHPSTASNTRRT